MHNPILDPFISCHNMNSRPFKNTLVKIWRKGSFNIQNPLLVLWSCLLKKKVVRFICAWTTEDWIDILSKIGNFYHWYQGYSSKSIMQRCTPRLICVAHIIWCKSRKVTNGRRHTTHVIVISSTLWCSLTSNLHLLSFNIWWIMFFL
jgi:hypothetical protein